MRVFLTGSTGNIGSAVLDALLRAGHRVTALVRDPEKATRLTSRGVTALVGELGSPKTYVGALAGADAVVQAAFESSPRGVEKDREAIVTLLAAIKATTTSGARPTFVYTSGVWILGNTTRPADEEAPMSAPQGSSGPTGSAPSGPSGSVGPGGASAPQGPAGAGEDPNHNCPNGEECSVDDLVPGAVIHEASAKVTANGTEFLQIVLGS